MNVYEKFWEVIQSSNSIAIYSHIQTDGDAVCSSLALYTVLTSMGKKVDVFYGTPLPTYLEFLPGVSILNQKNVGKYQTVVALDCNNADRLGKAKYTFFKYAVSLQIDHHPNNPNFAKTVNIVETSTSSTCEILYGVLKHNHVVIDKQTALYLLTGMLTDTGGFMFNNTTYHVLQKAGELLKILNTDISSITTPLFQSVTWNEFLLNKLAMQKLETVHNGVCALLILTQEDFRSCNTQIENAKSIIKIGMQLADVKVVVLCSEDPEGFYRVSFRSKGDIDISKCAAVFGGGGLKNASGCRIYSQNPSFVRKEILRSLEVIQDAWGN